VGEGCFGDLCSSYKDWLYVLAPKCMLQVQRKSSDRLQSFFMSIVHCLGSQVVGVI